MEEIQLEGKWIFPKEKVDLLKDKTDNKFLEAAFAANADYLITGNYLDFRIREFKNTQIVSPQQYWHHFSMNF
jgi:predicted nucleic acid-binding protein